MEINYKYACNLIVVTIQKFDLTRHTNERFLLNLVFLLHSAFLVTVFVLHSLDSYLLFSKYRHFTLNDEGGQREAYKKFVASLIILGVSIITVTKCVILLGLARKKVRFYLRWYKIWNMILIPTYIMMDCFIKVFVVEPRNLAFAMSIFFILITVKIYLILTVIRMYHKMGSEIIEKLKEQKEKEDAEAPPEINLNKTKNSNPLDAKVKVLTSNEKTNFKISESSFLRNILSPLSISIDTSNFIGEGQFGSVYKGNFRRKGFMKVEVAAKVVKNSESGDTLQMLLQEIKIAIWAGQHPNIVKFFGISSDMSLNAQCAIITEFCQQGNLEHFLVNNRHTFNNQLIEQGNIVYANRQLYVNLELHGTHSSMDLIRFAQEIASGMSHLSSKNIIHGDLAARNILLTADLRVKLSDFGMSRRLYSYQVYRRLTQNDETKLPWRWMAYEAIKDLKFSTKSDVWSFAVVLFEIFTLGSFPFEKLKWTPDILQKIENGMRLERPVFASAEIYMLMKSCWNLDPRLRPTFKELEQAWNIIASRRKII